MMAGKPHGLSIRHGFLSRVCRPALRHPQADSMHRLLERFSILRFMNGLR